MGRPASCFCTICPKCKNNIRQRRNYHERGVSGPNLERVRAYQTDLYHNDAEYRRRHDARKLLSQQVRRGIQTRGPCALCGGESTMGHHNDYAKPLEGTWLCAPCHVMIHNALPAS